MLLTSGRGRLCALRRDGLRTDGEVDGRWASYGRARHGCARELMGGAAEASSNRQVDCTCIAFS
jgi:hypothetical protein